MVVGRGASTGDGPLFLRRARDLYVQTGSNSQSIRAVYVIHRFYFIFKKGPISRRDELAASHHAVKEVVVEVVKEVHVVQKVEVVKKVYVEVDVLPKGEPRPEPLFRGGQSVHQWWASWMSGAYETPAGIKGKHGRPAWYSASVYSWEQLCLQACGDAGVRGVAICRE